MIGKGNRAKKPEPLDIADALLPSPTREMMLALLARDRKTPLTPREIMEQTKNLRYLLGRIDFFLSDWNPERVKYGEVLSQIERMIQGANNLNREIRDRAEQVVRDEQAALLEKRLAEAPKFGQERVDSAPGYRPRQDSYGWRRNG